MTAPRSPNPGRGRELDVASWSGFLATFHGQRPGITAAILEASVSDNATPYGWLVEALPGSGSVVDVACGNGPLAELIGPRWIGTDRSESELALVMAQQAGRSVVSDASSLPFATNATDTVACSMALHVTQPLPSVLAEMARVLKPGGRLVAIIPARHPLTLRDRWRYARLIRTLGDGLSAPTIKPSVT